MLFVASLLYCPLAPMLGTSEANSFGIHNFPETSVAQEAATKEAGTQCRRKKQFFREHSVGSLSRGLL